MTGLIKNLQIKLINIVVVNLLGGKTGHQMYVVEGKVRGMVIHVADLCSLSKI